MTNPIVEKALSHWGLDGGHYSLVAERENKVFHVENNGAIRAMRLHRVGYRSAKELQSELDWMAMLADGGLNVPHPISTLDGTYCVTIDGVTVDVLSWLEGTPLADNGKIGNIEDVSKTYHSIGQAMALLHNLSDRWEKPQSFSRPRWDADGLIGDSPLWGRFWENPELSNDQLDRILVVKNAAHDVLDHPLDYGLIHADILSENVMVNGNDISLIDFDDGGFGYRLFDLATTLNRAHRNNHALEGKPALIEGYTSRRELDLTHLPLFQALRSYTYLGWNITRMEEPGARERNQRFVTAALFWTDEYLKMQ